MVALVDMAAARRRFLAKGVQLDVADLVVAIAITQGGGSDFGL